MKQLFFLCCIAPLNTSFSLLASQTPPEELSNSAKKELKILLLDIVKKNKKTFGPKKAQDLERSISDHFSSDEDLNNSFEQQESPVGLPPLYPTSVKKIKTPKTPPYRESRSLRKKKVKREPETIAQRLVRINSLPLLQRKKAEKQLHDEEFEKFFKQQKELEELNKNRMPCKKLLQSFSGSVWDYEKPLKSVKKKRPKKRLYEKLEEYNDDEILKSWILLEKPNQN